MWLIRLIRIGLLLGAWMDWGVLTILREGLFSALFIPCAILLWFSLCCRFHISVASFVFPFAVFSLASLSQ